MRRISLLPVVLLLVSGLPTAPLMDARQPAERVSSLRITMLSTMLADRGIGEWGFAALVEADGYRVLFDTGARPETVRQNAIELGIDLGTVPDVVLSHHHGDHTGGLLTLRTAAATIRPTALGRLFVGRGIFYPRPSGGAPGWQPMREVRAAYEATGGQTIEIHRPHRLAPGVWLTGPIPRTHPERNYPASARVETPDGVVEDTLPEDIALVVDTADGLVVLTGCGHAGVVNTIEQARRAVRVAPIEAVLGGMHLLENTDAQLAWTASKFTEFGVRHVLGAHCTGIEAVYQLRSHIRLPRAACLVGAVGASYELGTGIRPGRVAAVPPPAGGR